MNNLVLYIHLYGPSIIRLVFLSGMAYWGIAYIEKKAKKALCGFYPDALRLSLVGSFFRYIAYCVIGIAVLHELGINIYALLGVAGVFGIAIGYASQASIANIISGLFLMVEQPFDLGDILIVAGQEGKLVSVNLFAITLKTSNGFMVRLPHEYVLKNHLINKTRFPFQRYNFDLKVDIQHDPSIVIDLIKKGVSQNQYSSTNCESFIMIKNLTGGYNTFTVGVWGAQKNSIDLKKTILFDINTIFVKNNIKMAVENNFC